MAYVAVTGGQEAIEASWQLLRAYRSRGEEEISLPALMSRMGLLLDRIMSEAGLYAPEYAALALKQCEGSPEEAVFLLRAYRNTLPRNYVSLVTDTEDMDVRRRISAAFKDVPGGQMLGPTYDYIHRLIDFELLAEDESSLRKWREAFYHIETEIEEAGSALRLPRVLDVLRREGLIEPVQPDDTPPCDVTLEKLPIPAPRGAILQTLSRADTGYISGLAYGNIRGFGMSHPTIGELRYGGLDVTVAYPYAPDEAWYVGEIFVTEVEALISAKLGHKGIDVGYGCVFGRNETKAIGMAILDHALRSASDAPTSDMEFVLLHGDCLEMNGFISHLKLPHYVTFQSKLDSLRAKQ